MSLRVINHYGDPLAAGLLPYLIAWYTFDNTPNSSVNPADGWTQTYGGSFTYSTGTKAQQMDGSVSMRAPGPLAYNQDWSFFLWIDNRDTTDGTYLFAVGDPTAFDAVSYAGIDIVTTGGASTAAGYAWDNNTLSIVFASSVVISAARLFFCVRWNNAAKTLTMSINAVDKPVATVTAILPAVATNVLTWQKFGGAAFDPYTKHADEWGVLAGHALTQAEMDYLYNSGAGKSYSEFLADT